MKPRFVILLCNLFICSIIFAQTSIFELRIEPQSISGNRGVLATLTNVSNCFYIIPSFSNAIPLVLPRASILIPERKMNDTSVTDGMQQGFFFAAPFKRKNLEFNPGESYQIWVSLQERINDLTGIASPSEINKIKQVRFRIDKFKAFTIVDKKLQMIDTTLYSNWLDIESIM